MQRRTRFACAVYQMSDTRKSTDIVILGCGCESTPGPPAVGVGVPTWHKQTPPRQEILP